ncbi:MAG: 16S rRNA (cytosine(967)-C(5))-methyltransferase RsmB [Verrucomicrobia bacterium]|nr:16S rRNA (cytosine(967)-C(5))-methyltransferase RsmB [Verrucomicrobiota bacterium]
MLSLKSPGDFAEHRMESASDFSALAAADRRLAQELVLGVLRWRDALDWLIARRSGGRPQEPVVREALRLAFYQVFWLDRIPDHAAVHDAVQSCRDAGRSRQSGFVNAVLRGSLREREAVRSLLTDLRHSDPATGWSHPAWLVDRWRTALGPEQLQRLLAWNNTPPGVSVRVNALKTTPDALAARWAGEGVSAAPRSVEWAPFAAVFDLLGHPPLATLPSFRDGGFYVQDPSTLLSVALLEPRSGERLLDACAAPGGKTTLIAQLQAGSGVLVAEDAAASRLDLLRENCERLGADRVEIGLPSESREAEFDGILVDAPCSNTGVLRRRVESRWRLSAAELPLLAERQLALLRAAGARLRAGGRMVYSTCSLEPEENRAVVDRFLSGTPEFVLETDRQLHPVSDGVDGAYAARLRKR